MKIFVISFLIACSFSSFADINSEVNAVMTLRQEVEVLSQEAENLKKAEQAQLDAYIQREQELTALLLKERFKTDQLISQINTGKKKIEDVSRKVKVASSDEWIKKFWDNYNNSLSAAHPFYSNKFKERLAKIRLDYAQKKISYEHALLQTWFVLDEDLKKAQDAEFVLAPLTIKNKLYHVEMVRMGRTKGYFRTADNQYGQLFYNKDWEMQFFTDRSSQKMIETLLTQFKQQQKTGLYNLPGIKL